MTIEAFAPAKINLTLHVTGQRADGYHLLDSLVVFADVGDRIRFVPAPSKRIDVSGPFSVGVPTDDRNLIWRAADLAGVTGHFSLEKNLPHGAGIGGGSSDAAAVLRLLGAEAHALALGADVPVCLLDVPQRMRGIGEDVTPVGAVPALDMVLVNPGVHVPTPEVFARLRQKENAGMDARLGWPDVAAFKDWLAAQRNDLQTPAASGNPAIPAALSALKGAEIVRMSGSGATCFGIYPDAQTAEVAADRIAQKQPRWWVRAVRTVGWS
ncbi:4-(cytidine 5'-diphospho)-2-C-methyl-D-erythritol kinase [Tateyamaria omphalii]|uniref:4-(cytidine 5'-diphospho)-2-C-methyl-D-erythritol kinase n=1 Tax=Tateyamaria omphalii TaxID=299262 RepID=UPI001C9A1920|nr:4-(cytidine 5'-diphospho)-2-C-methyl-D-erythritol kinase [Tateyamaria omphalii]MBY5931616.1 4-(cytidine 5'-diphospho)-2-C-methyl-D-erythritol kinase [Tateyamaria omphalii]